MSPVPNEAGTDGAVAGAGGAEADLVVVFFELDPQAASISSPAVLAAALSIHTVEARHAATLATLVPGGHVTPDGAFGKPADAATVLAAVKPFIA